MKTTNLLFIAILSLAACLNAQNEITADYRYVIGDTVYFEAYTNVDASSGASGTDQVWDFSNLELTDGDSTFLIYTDPDELTGAAAAARDQIAPQSNIAARSFNNDGINDFILFRYQDENIVESYGSFFIPSPQIVKVSNPIVLYTFPMSLFAEITNTYTDSIFVQDPDLGVWNLVTTIDRQNEVVFDGIGEVITDEGTFSNCLRLKRIRPGATSYSWIQNSVGNLIVSLTEFDDPSLMPSISFGSGGTQSTTSTKEDEIIAKPIIHLTQDGFVSISFDQGVYDYFLIDHSGRQIAKGTINQNQPNTKHDLLSNVNTTFGVYYIVLVDNKTGHFTTSNLLIP